MALQLLFASQTDTAHQLPWISSCELLVITHYNLAVSEAGAG